jgi:hypothetical protein
MQINYEYIEDRRAYAAGFWNPPDIENTAQDMDVPVIYAPYGLPGWWRDGATPYVAPQDSSLAPNSAQGTTVAGSMSGLGRVGDSGTSLTPNTLVAQMPSIVTPKNPQVTYTATCDVSNWVANNTGLAILAAVAVFAFAVGGSK